MPAAAPRGLRRPGRHTGPCRRRTSGDHPRDGVRPADMSRWDANKPPQTLRMGSDPRTCFYGTGAAVHAGGSGRPDLVVAATAPAVADGALGCTVLRHGVGQCYLYRRYGGANLKRYARAAP